MMRSQRRILFLGLDDAKSSILEGILRDNAAVKTVRSLSQLAKIRAEAPYDAAFCGWKLRDATWREALEHLLSRFAETPVVVFADEAARDDRESVIRAGGFELLTPPYWPTGVLAVLEQSTNRARPVRSEIPDKIPPGAAESSGAASPSPVLLGPGPENPRFESAEWYGCAAPDALQHSSQLMQLLLGAYAVGFAVLDRNGSFRAVNAALAAINGIPPREHVGKTVREVLPQIADEIESVLAAVFNSGEAALKVGLTTRTGKRQRPAYWLVDYLPLKNSSGKVEQVVALVVELTNALRTMQQATESERHATL